MTFLREPELRDCSECGWPAQSAGKPSPEDITATAPAPLQAGARGSACSTWCVGHSVLLGPSMTRAE